MNVKIIFPPPTSGTNAHNGQGLLLIEVSRSNSETPQLVGLLWTCDRPDAETSTCTTHNTHNRQTTIALLWTSDRPDTETSTCTKHNTHNRQTSISPAGFEPAIPRRERPQTHSLECAAQDNNAEE